MQTHNILRDLKVSSLGGVVHSGPLLGFIAIALVAPFALLTIGGSENNHLPWYFWTAIPLVLLVVTGIGFLRFNRESHNADDISISPERR